MPTTPITSEADLRAWELGIPTTPTEPFVAELQNSITLTSLFHIGPDDDPNGVIGPPPTGWYATRNTTSSNYIEIRPKAGLAWNDTPGTPFRPDASLGISISGSLSGGSSALMVVSDPYVHIHDLPIINLGGGALGVGACIYTWSFSDYFLGENLLCIANQPNQFGVIYLHNNQMFRNNVIINMASVSNDSHGSNGIKINFGTTSVLNCVIGRPSFVAAPSASYGICPAFSTVNPLIANNAIFGYTVPIHNLNDDGGTPPFTSLASGSGWNATDSSAMTDNIPGVGVNNLTALSYALQFNDIGSSSSYLSTIDFRLKNGSSLIDAGTDLSGTGFSVDARKTSRPQGSAWDIGAYEWTVPSQGGVVGILTVGSNVRFHL